MSVDEPILGRCTCFLCDTDAYLLTPYPDRLVERIKCPYCGKYGISVQVLDLKTYQKRTRSIVSGMAFDSFFYGEKEKLVVTTDFDAADITEQEKLFRLARYFYTAAKRGSIELEANPASCYESNSPAFCDKLETLKQKGIITYTPPSVFDDSGDYASHFLDIRMTPMAKIAFEKGIETPEEFERVFMSKDKTVQISVPGHNNQVNVALDNGSITAAQNNAPNMAELQPLIDRLLAAVPHDSPKETLETVKESIEAIQTEAQSPAPKKGLIKTILTGLSGVIRTAEFGAALAGLITFFSG